LVFAVLLCRANALAAAPLPQLLDARVIYVTDGDTVKIRDADRKEHSVRIVSIDAPEKTHRDKPGQRYSEKSRRHLARLADDRRVRLETHGRDDYGRVLARVWVDGVDVGLAQVCAGYAWVYEAFIDELPDEADRSAYRACQATAKANRLGLWRDAKPTPPWVFRHTRRDNDGRP
jgi:endonuclease YncB( thermonuclease family)